MTTGGIAFLVAFPLMMGLIVWVIWSFSSDRANDAPFLTDVTPALPSINAARASPAKSSALWQAFTFGAFVLIVGSCSYWYWNTNFPTSSDQQQAHSVGVALLGLFSIYLGFRNWRISEKTKPPAPPKSPS